MALCVLLFLTASCRPDLPPPTTTPTAEPPTSKPRPTETVTLPPPATASPAPTPTAVCRHEEGSLQRAAYRSDVLAEDVAVSVYRPSCYQLQAGPLPVVYFLHGKPFDEEHWVSLDLIETYEAGLERGDWGPALLVLPQLPEPLFSRSDGGPGSYEQEFIEELLPHIESRYRATDQRTGRRLAGISRGAIWALEIGLRHPDQFESVAALSPSLAVNYPRPAYDPFHLAAGPDLPGRILLLAGEEDWARPATERLAGILAAEATDLEIRIVPGQHADPTWSAAMEEVLRFLLAGIAG